MRYRLGLDMGANSIGWCVLGLDGAGRPERLLDLGVRVFSDGRDPQSGTSLASERRTARAQRRRRDRYLRRRADLMDELVRHRLMPRDGGARKRLEVLDPYELRARALDEPVSPHELGRALFHLNQRRGFRSNRKAERGSDEDPGKIKAARDRLRQDIEKAGARTLGEYLWWRHRERRGVRARLQGEGAKAEYELYPGREMLEAEFDALWERQAEHHPHVLTDAAREELRGILFRQRPLRPVDPGRCALDPSDSRAPWALPSAQRFRILQELANLRIIHPDQTTRPLTPEEHGRALNRLCRSKEVTFVSLGRLLKLGPEERFNLESDARSRMKGDQTAALLAAKSRFGKAWHELDLATQDAVVERLLAEEDEDALVDWLCRSLGLDETAAMAVSNAPLLTGYARLGRNALSSLVPIMQEEWRDSDLSDPDTGEVLSAPVTYDKAAALAGYHHSDMRPGRRLERLPYYGRALQRHVAGTGDPRAPKAERFGRIGNPTVHIGLNQLRRVVNGVIREHGPPAEIVVELARELKLSRERQIEIQREQADNRRKNDERREKLASLGVEDNGENRLKLRLWEELNPREPHNRRCVYSGEVLSLARLFSPEVEIEHILPFKRSLDNSPANKTVSLRSWNRLKANFSPFEAFGHSDDWPAILERAHGLPKNKRWRFAPDAMQRFEGEQDFLDRHLTDTAYLSRVTKAYLSHVCDPDRVWVTPGRLTAMLRGLWGLNQLLSDHNLKERRDLRHHAIDAFVVGLTDRSLLQRVSSAADEVRERLIQEMPEPWDGFREELRERLRRTVVSVKPDRGTQGKLHEETAFGLVADPQAENGYNVVHRKPFAALNENEIARIRDRDLRAAVQTHVERSRQQGKPLKQALAEFNARREEQGLPPVRRVRLLKREEDLVRIRDAAGHPYKAYSPGDNHRIEVFERPDGRWDGEAVTVFDANRPDYRPAWRERCPDARLVMWVHKRDLLRITQDGEDRVMRVVRLNAKARRLYLAEHHESGDLQKRHDDPDDPFRWLLASYGKLQELGARPVVVDELGRIFEPPQ